MERPLISYDDITLPYNQPEPGLPPAATNSPSGPSRSSKKRKWSKKVSLTNQNNKAANGPTEHEADDEDEDGDSRYLTQEEIWDDSALIDAWDAATEEYEALNGPDKGWKSEPVHKSPLWYNVPPTKSPHKKLKTESANASADAGPSRAGPEAEEGDSQPLDFDTFVPKHDAALGLPALDSGPRYAFSGAVLPPGMSAASQDEAFSRALEAMYWGGYWTAVYHHHRNAQRTEADADAVGEGGDDDSAIVAGGAGGREYGEEDEEEFVSTQR
ncbi:hypothetical protein B0H12DRAFT_1077212 [Mycena haematopus]|nr:hypothetical protein B0H12DRAFT_1077212 [Mycena haematopus]